MTYLFEEAPRYFRHLFGDAAALEDSRLQTAGQTRADATWCQQCVQLIRGVFLEQDSFIDSFWHNETIVPAGEHAVKDGERS
jgi:hypothetical protein